MKVEKKHGLKYRERRGHVPPRGDEGQLAGKSWQTALTDKGLKIKWQISVK